MSRGGRLALASNETPEPDKAKLRSKVDALIFRRCRGAGAQRLPYTYYQGDKAHLRLTELTHSP